jgi:hypothetical protein
MDIIVNDKIRRYQQPGRQHPHWRSLWTLTQILVPAHLNKEFLSLTGTIEEGCLWALVIGAPIPLFVRKRKWSSCNNVITAATTQEARTASSAE